MTRGEVMALTDEELRVKAAELAGTSSGHCLGSRCAFYPTDGTCKPVCGVPDSPHDIAAAWELVDLLKGKWSIQLNCHRGPNGEPPQWYCQVTRWAEPHDRLWIDGESAPLAITRAFVLARTQEAK